MNTDYFYSSIESELEKDEKGPHGCKEVISELNHEMKKKSLGKSILGIVVEKTDDSHNHDHHADTIT